MGPVRRPGARGPALPREQVSSAQPRAAAPRRCCCPSLLDADFGGLLIAFSYLLNDVPSLPSPTRPRATFWAPRRGLFLSRSPGTVSSGSCTLPGPPHRDARQGGAQPGPRCPSRGSRAPQSGARPRSRVAPPKRAHPGAPSPHRQLCPHSPAYTQQILSPNETAAPQ